MRFAAVSIINDLRFVIMPDIFRDYAGYLQTGTGGGSLLGAGLSGVFWAAWHYLNTKCNIIAAGTVAATTIRKPPLFLSLFSSRKA